MKQGLDKKILFYGAGNMAEGIIRGFIEKKTVAPEHILAFNRNQARLSALQQAYGLRPVKNGERQLSQALAEADMVVIAVRPQDAGSVLERLRGEGGDSLVISICAGLTLSDLAAALGQSRSICRVMPNVLIETGHGYSAVALNQNVSAEDQAALQLITDSLGQTIFMAESAFDAFTAFSCAGPAYLLSCISALIDAGVEAGFPRPEARKMVLENCLGSALALMDNQRHPGQIIDSMTSPAGVTIAAVHQMAASGLQAALMDSVQAALQRAKGLEGTGLSKRRQ